MFNLSKIFQKPKAIENAPDVLEAVAPLSKEKGEFLPEMTEAEVLAYERNERLGWKDLKLPWHKDVS